jgi:DNA processing protein
MMDRIARAAILASCEGDDRTLFELVAREGEQSALTALGISNDLGAQVLAVCEEHQIRLIVPSDDEWPTQLDQLPVPPLGLFVRGVENLRLLAARSIAIVGSRAASGYGVRVASDIAADLGEQGWSIISGLAFGIDAAAHRGALAVSASTAAVLAGGLDAIYPIAHTQLGDQIRSHGVLISEVAPGMPPMRHRFLTRNRIIAALTRGTLVVEAAHRSGSLRTAATAEAMLRPVMAVPGSIHAPASAGVHQWIADRRAELITSATDVLAIVGELNSAPVQPPLLARREEEVLHVLNKRPQLVDQIAHASQRAVADVMAALGVLALFGLAKQREGAWMRTP